MFDDTGGYIMMNPGSICGTSPKGPPRVSSFEPPPHINKCDPTIHRHWDHKEGIGCRSTTTMQCGIWPGYKRQNGSPWSTPVNDTACRSHCNLLCHAHGNRSWIFHQPSSCWGMPHSWIPKKMKFRTETQQKWVKIGPNKKTSKKPKKKTGDVP